MQHGSRRRTEIMLVDLFNLRKKLTIWKKQDYSSNMLYVNALRDFHQSQQNFPFQNKHSCNDLKHSLQIFLISTDLSDEVFTKDMIHLTG